MEKIEYIKMYELENYHFWFLGKRLFADTIISPYKKQIKSILDLGAGTGGMTKYLEKYGKVTGIEKNPIAINLAKKKGINIIQKDIQKIKTNKKKYDLITMFDVLYHKNIKDESEMIRLSRKLLKSHGLLLITDSALKILASKHDTAVQSKTRYSLKEMESILVHENFKILKKTYIYFLIFPFVFIKRVLIDRLIKDNSSDVKRVGKITNKILLKAIYLESQLLKYISFPIGSSILILAQKNE